jgi:penicillin-binding protein 1C
VDGVLARRQPGSTLKPFLYAQAIAEKRLTAASLIEDSAAQIRTANGLYIPQNYDRSFKGWVSARTALAASLNVPAVRTLVMVTPMRFSNSCRPWACRCRKAAATTATAWRWAAARSPAGPDQCLPRAGQRRALHPGGLGQCRTAGSALDAGAAFIVGDILSDRNARARPSAPTACWPRASGPP